MAQTAAAVLALARQARRVYPPGAGFAGLEPAELQTLTALLQGEQSVRALAERLDLSRFSVSNALKPLHHQGLVAHRVDPSDGRIQLQRLTPKGKRSVRRFLIWAGRQLTD